MNIKSSLRCYERTHVKACSRALLWELWDMKESIKRKFYKYFKTNASFTTIDFISSRVHGSDFIKYIRQRQL
jgi:hypothetical protein